jgi:hypothetical protein
MGTWRAVSLGPTRAAPADEAGGASRRGRGGADDFLEHLEVHGVIFRLFLLLLDFAPLLLLLLVLLLLRRHGGRRGATGPPGPATTPSSSPGLLRALDLYRTLKGQYGLV